jgi:formylglycine-generating enzyme required for sulfatase activity
LHSQFAEDPEFINKFVKEAQAAATLRGCPQIVEVFDITQTDDGHLILVMEYLQGGDLGALIQQSGRLGIEDSVWYASQIAQALHAAHWHGFIHRDVKPSNMLLGADKRVAKLSDFGFIAERDSAQPTSIVRGGSTGFAAPEQWMQAGKHLDGRTDLYALGVTLYLMLSGRLPYGELELGAWSAAVRSGPPPPVRSMRPETPAALDELVQQLLAADREQRPANAEAVLARLRECLANPVSGLRTLVEYPPVPSRATLLERPSGVPSGPIYGAPSAPTSPPSSSPPRSTGGGRSAKWIVAGIAVLIAVIGGAGWLASPARNPSSVQPIDTSRQAARPSTSFDQHKIGQTRVNQKDGLTYAWIPPGSFQFGCSPGDSECFGDELPARHVNIPSGFWIGQTEVSQPAFKRITGADPSSFKGADLPVESVTWFEAASYCQSIGGRLPTEREAEYAARGPNGAASRYGELGQVAWYTSNSWAHTHPIGTLAANGYGLYDTLGNVWEWVDDWYGTYTAADPPATGDWKVLRGGSWGNEPKQVRVSARVRDRPSTRFRYSGFRCIWQP